MNQKSLTFGEHEIMNKTSIATILGAAAVSLLKTKGSASSDLKKYRNIGNLEDLLNCPDDLKSQVFSVALSRTRETKAPFKGIILPDDVFSGMDKIQRVDISEADNVPSSILDLPNLKGLDVAPEKDTGEIPSIVFQLENLEDLHISIFSPYHKPNPNVYARALSGFEPLVISKNIQNLKNLELLRINVIPSDNWLPSEIINLNNLIKIEFDILGMTKDENDHKKDTKWYLPEFLAQIPNLEWIDIVDSRPYNGIPYGFIHKVIQRTIGQLASTRLRNPQWREALSNTYNSDDGLDVKWLIDINVKIAELSRPGWNYGTYQYEKNKPIRLGTLYPLTYILMREIGVPREKLNLLVEYSEKPKSRQNVVKLRKR
jgi:hypothetical protein